MILAPLLLAAALSQAGAAAPAPEATPAAAAPALAAPRLSGFVQAAWTALDAPGGGRDQNGFEVARARLRLSGHVLPRLSYELEADVAEDAAARLVKDAYVAFEVLPGAEVRLGQFKPPFGWEQTEPEVRLPWVATSHVVAALSRGPDAHDVGAGLFGRWEVAGPVGVELAAAVVNGAGPNTADELVEKNAWSRAGGWVALAGWRARAGVSYAYGRQLVTVGADGRLGTLDDRSFYFHRFGGDLEVDGPWLFAVVEGAATRTRLSDAAGVAQGRGVMAAAWGKTPWRLGPVVRWEQYAPFDRVKGNDRQRVTLGAYWDLAAAARLVLDCGLDLSDAAARTGNAAALQAQVTF